MGNPSRCASHPTLPHSCPKPLTPACVVPLLEGSVRYRPTLHITRERDSSRFHQEVAVGVSVYGDAFGEFDSKHHFSPLFVLDSHPFAVLGIVGAQE